MNTPEHNSQVELFQWASIMEGQIPALKNMYANTNAQKFGDASNIRKMRTIIRLREEGQRAGIPDITLAFPHGGFHGMYLEMKAGRNKTSPAQNEWIARLQQAGYMCVVAYSFEEAKREILAYLEVQDV